MSEPWDKFRRIYEHAEADEQWAASLQQGLSQALREFGAGDRVRDSLVAAGGRILAGGVLRGVDQAGVQRAAEAAGWAAVEEFARLLTEQSMMRPER